jgi:hypothetical protein
MGTLISFLVHPFSTLRRFRDQYDQEGSIGDLIYHVTLFFAFGIYFVMRRHLNARSRAKSFRIEPPPVCLSLLSPFARVTLFDFPGSRSVLVKWADDSKRHPRVPQI